MTSPFTATSRVDYEAWQRLADRYPEVLAGAMASGGQRAVLFAESTRRIRHRLSQSWAGGVTKPPRFRRIESYLEGCSISIDDGEERSFGSTSEFELPELTPMARATARRAGDDVRSSSYQMTPADLQLPESDTDDPAMSEEQAREALRVASEYAAAAANESMQVHVELVETATVSFVARAEEGDDAASFSRRHRTALVVRCLPEYGSPYRVVRATGANQWPWIQLAAESIAKEIRTIVGGTRWMGLESEMRLPVLLSAGWCAGVWFHEAVGHQLEADHVERSWSSVYPEVRGRLAPSALTVLDAPGQSDQPGHLITDDEASPCADTVLIDGGRVVGLLHDRRTAGAFGEAPTGNGRRQDYRFQVQPRMTNLIVKSGDATSEALAREFAKCVRVRSLSRGCVDGPSGRFSFVVDWADMMQSGEPCGLITDATITGTVVNALSSIVMIGDDAHGADGRGRCVKNGQVVDIGLVAPSILIEELTIAPTTK